MSGGPGQGEVQVWQVEVEATDSATLWPVLTVASANISPAPRRRSAITTRSRTSNGGA